MDFKELGFHPRLVTRLAEAGLTTPTPIQEQAIPLAMEGRDVMGLAQTGTGKTAAFGLPLIHHIAGRGRKPQAKTAAGLVLAPTRELAKQIAENLGRFTKGSHLKVAVVVGGASIGRQAQTLGRGVDLLIATPGRLIDLIERRAVRLDQTEFLVLDEADQMLDMGFIHALRRIAPLLAEKRQTMLFSATMPKQMAELAGAFLKDPVRVEVSPPGKAADRIEQSIHFVQKADKQALLIEQLRRHPKDLALVFARTKFGAERLMKNLVKEGFPAASIHGNKSQGQRDRAIKGFRSGEVKVLVATDVAARGIDIPGVGYVYNFDLPNVAENYVHRIGRTARAGAAGEAIAFCAPDEAGYLRDIQKVLGHSIPVVAGEPWQMAKAEKPKSQSRRRPSRNRRRRPVKQAA
ncbi:MAG: DEAD/DEAH box helicase [Pseudomonadota bacterium]